MAANDEKGGDELLRLRERVRALEEELARSKGLGQLASEELNRRIVEAMPCGLVHVGSDGAILSANGEALRILGYSYDALTKRYTKDFDPETIWEDGSPCPVGDYPATRALVTGLPQPPATIGTRRPDGKLSWAIFTAVPVKDPATGATSSVVVTFLDITERKKAEASLHEQEALLRSILANAPNFIAYTDDAGNVRFVNRSAAMSDVVGKPAWHQFSGADRALIQRNFEEVMATGEVRRFEATTMGRRFLIHVAPVLDGTQRVGVIFVTSDVTEQRTLEASLMIADRMAAIGTLTAGIAHEINNPLTYLLANIDWLERAVGGAAASETAQRCLAAAKEGANRIRTVVADLSTFSHVGESRKVIADVHALLDSALRMAENTIRARARVVREFGDIAPVYASDSHLAQVFLNLIVNAAQAIGDGDPDRDFIAVRTSMTPEGRVAVEVRDTGPGVPPDIAAKIFDPFVTTKPVGVGTGLGLYICRNVVTALGGEITVRNDPDGGAIFRVVLPPAGGSIRPAPISPRAAPASQRTPGKRLRILVVDDEPSILAVVKTYLDKHHVTVAHGGREALALVDAETFDVILCDVMMPEVTGIEVYEAVKAKHPGREREMIFITGGAVTDRTHAFLASLPNAVLTKPFGPEELTAVVEQHEE